MIVGYATGWAAPIIPKLQDPAETPLAEIVTDATASWIGSFFMIGSITGPHVASYLSNIVGRKPCFYLGGIITVLSFVLVILTRNTTMVLALRILMGFGAGILFVGNIVYIGEIATSKPSHLICFKQWTGEMVMNIISSAINLKYCYNDTHCRRMDVLQDCKIMVLQEVNEPVLNMAVSKAATLLGAFDVTIIDHVIWEQDYNGSIFSYMADAIFVATSTHHCVQRFANQATVPVMCMRSRTHASIQALSTVMAIIEEFGEMKCLNIGFIGPPHPVLNSFLLLCPMLGANIKFLCCCPKCPVTPLLFKESKKLKETNHTNMNSCKDKAAVLDKTDVIIAGPTAKDTEKIPYFAFDVNDIRKSCHSHWVFFHTCPRGAEVKDDLFYHENSRTFKCFENMQYIAAALMANSVKGHRF